MPKLVLNLWLPFFPMHENLSHVIGSRGADLTKPRLSQLVKNSDIEFEDDDYEKNMSRFMRWFLKFRLLVGLHGVFLM